MRSWVVIAPPIRAESVRRRLRSRGLLRKDLRAARSKNEVAFPVYSLPEPPLEHTRVEERDLPSEPRPVQSYRELLHLPPELQALLPRAFDVVGDVVLVRLPPELQPHAAQIGEALLRFVPGTRKVGWDQGVHGEARLRRLTPLAGTGPWRTEHRENGIGFLVDPEVAYFSPRLAREHVRVASQVTAHETVFDLCCGIGPFAVTIARRGVARTILAVDSNPAAIALLRENAARLAVAARIDARNEPLERFLPTAGAADRIILNLPHEGIKYLPRVSAAVAPGGTLHYYEVTARADRSMRGTLLVNQLDPARWSCVEERRVHPYSPQADLVAY
ncbi:MAG TPA: methyltransferase domain-containing protein, partial [Thermoplasmata archaeon]|nr:methyltransferase domain-containing protein [Thermoplasmata archaeon]